MTEKLIFWLIVFLASIAFDSGLKLWKKIKASRKYNDAFRRTHLEKMIRVNMKSVKPFDPVCHSFEMEVRFVYTALYENGKRDRAFVLGYIRKFVGSKRLFDELHESVRSKSELYFFDPLERFVKEKAVRPFEEWKAYPPIGLSNNKKNLVRYLFERHAVPHFIESVWLPEYWGFIVEETRNHHRLTDPLIWRARLLELYFYVTEGKNLRYFKPLGFRPSKKEAATMLKLNAKSNEGLLSVFWKAVYITQGGVANSFYKFSNTKLSIAHLEFWRMFLHIAAKDKSATKYGIKWIVEAIRNVKFGLEEPDYFYGQYANRLKKIAVDYEIRGKTLKTIKKDLYEIMNIRYDLPEELERSYGFAGKGGRYYRMVFLGGRDDLVEDAAEMNFCIDDWEYHQRALDGSACYWSLREIGDNGAIKRLLTLTVEWDCIIEFQGFGNSYPPEEAIEVMNRWARDREYCINDYEEA